MLKILFFLPAVLVAGAFFISCDQDKKILVTKEYLVTSEAGDKIAQKKNISFVKGKLQKEILLEYIPQLQNRKSME